MPSYIKELADRIHSIENKLESEGAGALSQDDIDRLFVSDRPARQTTVPDDSRKRPFSSISTGDFTTPSRQTPWGSEHRPMQPGSGASDGFGGTFSTESLAPQPSAVKPDGTPSKPPVAAMDITMPDTEDVPDFDEELLHE